LTGAIAVDSLSHARQENVLPDLLTTEGKMATCEQEALPAALELPRTFDGLEGLLQADLDAIVGMLTERARERLFLSRRQQQQLQANLYNSLTEALNNVLEPLSAEMR
jgi:hypothetical protein